VGVVAEGGGEAEGETEGEGEGEGEGGGLGLVLLRLACTLRGLAQLAFAPQAAPHSQSQATAPAVPPHVQGEIRRALGLGLGLGGAAALAAVADAGDDSDSGGGVWRCLEVFLLLPAAPPPTLSSSSSSSSALSPVAALAWRALALACAPAPALAAAPPRPRPHAPGLGSLLLVARSLRLGARLALARLELGPQARRAVRLERLPSERLAPPLRGVRLAALARSLHQRVRVEPA
jgi:hypothetical protein